MNPDETLPYESSSAVMWTGKGDRLTVVGDHLGRLPSLKILDAQPGEVVLDAGCGSGFIARRLVRDHGAVVLGCDRSPTMLSRAREHETLEPLGIIYDEADITKELPYPSESFDRIACIAVLIHDSPEECQSFFREAYQVLKYGGRLIVSIMHPDLFQADSPARTGQASWVQYEAMETAPMTQSQRFAERYVDSEGNVFDSTVWYHPASLFPEQLKEEGFVTTDVFHQHMTREVLIACNASGSIGYRAFYQVLATK